MDINENRSKNDIGVCRRYLVEMKRISSHNTVKYPWGKGAPITVELTIMLHGKRSALAYLT